ncbi:hypothetical protein K440DRAFT_564452 [Wilcoxina mikolae CBS 423.85]|nr:hypothetical protein K440DRAFT_564452 [Wilcoxina mikolae CBS 423.85]
MGCAFFVVMGGYVVHPAPGEFDGIPVTLTPCGFIQLYEEKMIKEKDLEPSLIADKTKADGLAKLIVCLQALWLVIQGIGRKATGLPLPLLELHTIMHVLCAVAMYWFWWDKPLDARFPIILDLEQHIAEEIYCSYGRVVCGMPPLPTHDQPQSGIPKNEDLPREGSTPQFKTPSPRIPGRKLSKEKCQEYPSFKGDGLFSWEAFLILGCISVLYGGAHAGAWNTHLPSTVERLLWRVSSVIAGAFLPLSMAVVVMSPFLIAMAALAIYILAGVSAFIFARTFLVVESFISLRSLPKGSFKTVPWSNYWPHF